MISAGGAVPSDAGRRVSDPGRVLRIERAAAAY